jgi:hypothetical protein
MTDVVCAHSALQDTTEALAELEPNLPIKDAVAVFFFCSSNHDGVAINNKLKALAPGAEIIGATTAGEFTHAAYSQGGVSVMALPSSKVKRCAAVLADFGKPGERAVEPTLHEAAKTLASKLSVDLRELDTERWVGILLNGGLFGNEEEVSEVLGHIAPFLSFVGGSAGDNLKVVETRVFYDGKVSSNGSALLLMELAVPYHILKTCSFEATNKKLRFDKVDGRIVHQIDGKPAVQGYADAIGVKVEDLGHPVFMANPVGVMIDGEPWVRSPAQVFPDGSMRFGAKIHEGASLNLLKATDLVRDTGDALAEGATKLGRPVSGALLFNCAHRCVEVQMKQLEAPFRSSIAQFPVAGFHSYGESWLAYVNQTLIALLLG